MTYFIFRFQNSDFEEMVENCSIEECSEESLNKYFDRSPEVLYKKTLIIFQISIFKHFRAEKAKPNHIIFHFNKS